MGVNSLTIVVRADHDTAGLARSHSLLHAKHRRRQRRDALGLELARSSGCRTRKGQLDGIPVCSDARLGKRRSVLAALADDGGLVIEMAQGDLDQHAAREKGHIARNKSNGLHWLLSKHAYKKSWGERTALL